jgi:hypothetical protein
LSQVIDVIAVVVTLFVHVVDFLTHLLFPLLESITCDRPMHAFPASKAKPMGLSWLIKTPTVGVIKIFDSFIGQGTTISNELLVLCAQAF